MWLPDKTDLRRWVQSSCSQSSFCSWKLRKKLFPLKYKKLSCIFWQVMCMKSSKLKRGRSLSSLPTKCQQWGKQIYLSVRISLEGKLAIKLMISKHPAAYVGKQQIQGANQSKEDPEPRQMDWETWVNELWLTGIWHLAPEQPGDASQCLCLPGNIPRAPHAEGRHRMALLQRSLRDFNAGNEIPELDLVWRTRIDVWKWAKDI